MPAINFKACFAADICSGRKKQTIRENGKRKVVRGATLYLYTGMRTKNCRQLLTAICTSARPIRIDAVLHTIDLAKTEEKNSPLERLKEDEALALARADGFASLDKFFAFFSQTYGRSFDGTLILWGNP
jgi:hypothetical protein